MAEAAVLSIRADPACTPSSSTGGAYVAICGEEEDDSDAEPTAYLAVRTPGRLPKPVQASKKTISFVIDEEPVSMEWEFADAGKSPPGSEDKFKEGKLTGKTYLDGTMNQPEHYLACHKAKSLTVDNPNYVNLAKKHFDIDADTKEVSRASSKPVAATAPDALACTARCTTEEAVPRT